MQNRLFSSLPEDTRGRLLQLMQPQALERHGYLYRAERPIDRVYLVETGLVSLVQRMRDGRTVEIGTVGSEGIVGVQSQFGLGRAELDTLVQMPGRAWTLPPQALQDEARRCERLAHLVRAAMRLLFLQIAQTAACNRLHTLDQRLCRWLLTAHDNAEGNLFPLTHEFLAMMLGVQRPGVTLSAGSLQALGLIRYARGWVEILDRERVEARACECYGVLRQACAAMFDGGSGED